MNVPDREQNMLNLINGLDQFYREKLFPSGLNIFEAAGLNRQEIRHSNFLAFLLSPQETHGLGDTFLKRLIQKALDNTSITPSLSNLTVALGDFSDGVVLREWKNIDLLVESKNNNFIFAIENKVGSTESETQLSKYEHSVVSEFPKHHKLFAYLTQNRDPASNDLWSTISYGDVVDALREAQSHHSTILTPEAKIVIEHYIGLIRRNIMPDQELIEQCRKLYAMHRDALDLIFRYGKVDAFVSAADLFFKSHEDIKPLLTRSGQAAFLPNPLLTILPEIAGINWWGQARPIIFWFNLRDEEALGLVIEVGPIEGDQIKREPLVKELLKYFNNKKQITPKYTRVYSEYKKLTEDQVGDAEAIQSIMNSLYESVASKHLSSVIDISRRFFVK